MTRSPKSGAPILTSAMAALLFQVVWGLIKLIIFIRIGVHAYAPAKRGSRPA
jgi:hypothetical protein